jgi:hypothetical protein
VDQEDLRPTLDFLAQNGVGAILDYAAEDDVNAEDGPASRSNQHNTVVARTYNYDTEDACDRHLKIFLHSIEAAAKAPGQGFAAIKVGCRPCCSGRNYHVLSCLLIGRRLAPPMDSNRGSAAVGFPHRRSLSRASSFQVDMLA